MINESTQDPSKAPLLRGTAFDKENSINILTGAIFQESKDFEELNNNLNNFKTKGFGNSSFPNYNSTNLGFLGGYGNSMFGQFDKHEMMQNNYDLNSNKNDISFLKKPLDFEFSNMPSNQNSAINFPHPLNLVNNGLVNLENQIFMNNSNNNPLMGDEPHFGDHEKNFKNFFGQSLMSNNPNKLMNMDSNLYFFGNKENSKKPLPLGNLEEEPRYVNEKQYNRMMIRRIKRAKEMALKSYRPPQPSTVERNLKKRYKYESRHQHATKRARDSNGKFLKKEKLMQEENNKMSSENNSQQTKREKKETKSNKIRKTNNPKNFKQTPNDQIIKTAAAKENQNTTATRIFEHKDDNNESFTEEPNILTNQIENSIMRIERPKKESMCHSDELENEEKNVLNLNLSFIKKEEEP